MPTTNAARLSLGFGRSSLLGMFHQVTPAARKAAALEAVNMIAIAITKGLRSDRPRLDQTSDFRREVSERGGLLQLPL